MSIRRVLRWTGILVGAGVLLILIGAGAIFLLEALARTQLPEFRRPVGGTLVFAIILIAVGLGDQVGWGVVGPIALIVAGAAVLLTTVFRRR